ncbi:MAG: NF038129 family PEP-CTERM protein [Luteolibacter sp.]
MKNKTSLMPALAAACALLGASSAYAAVSYQVSINTSALAANVTSSPFSLDFQLIGNGGNNSATISNFNFGGGSATSGTENYTGSASGNLGTTISLNNTSGFLNEFFQEFTPGSTLSFTLNLSTNVASPTPDGFTFAILDKDLFNITTDGLGDSLFHVDITGATYGTQTVQTGSGTGAFAGVTTTAVPEPSAALLGGLGVLVLLKRRRN